MISAAAAELARTSRHGREPSQGLREGEVLLAVLVDGDDAVDDAGEEHEG